MEPVEDYQGSVFGLLSSLLDTKYSSISGSFIRSLNFFFLLHDEIYAILCILDGVLKQKVLKVGIKSSN